MLLRKCFSGPVKSSFDKPAKNFPVKIQFFLVKVQKNVQTIVQEFFLKFLLCTLRKLFRHTGLFFCQNQKKLNRSPKKDDDNGKNYFYHFFSKFCWRHVQCTFMNLPKVFSPSSDQRSKTIKQLLFTLLSKKTSKRPAAATRRLPF